MTPIRNYGGHPAKGPVKRALRLKHFCLSLRSHSECAMNKLLSVRAQTENSTATLLTNPVALQPLLSIRLYGYGWHSVMMVQRLIYSNLQAQGPPSIDNPRRLKERGGRIEDKQTVLTHPCLSCSLRCMQ